jgi:hypothetical protein
MPAADAQRLGFDVFAEVIEQIVLSVEPTSARFWATAQSKNHAGMIWPIDTPTE